MALLNQLYRDKVFVLAALLGPIFWWLNTRLEFSPQISSLSMGYLLMVVLVYPLLEELCFRGVLQGAILQTYVGRAKCLGLSVANAITSAVFVLFHLSGQHWIWAAAVIFPSLIFGLLREKYDSTVPSIILHCFYNFGFFVLR